MTDYDLNLTKQHYNTKIFKSYIYLLKKDYPHIDIEKLCLEAGLPLSYLNKETNWVSQIFAYRFSKLCLEKTKDKNFFFETGRISFCDELFDKSLLFVIKKFLSVEMVYKNIAQLTSHFNKILKIDILKSQPGFFHLNFSILVEKLNKEELNTIKTHIYQVIENTLGYYSTIPTLYGQEPAQIEHEIILDENDIPTCQMKITYKAINPIWKTFAYTSYIAIIGIGLYTLYLYSYISPLTSILIFIIGILLGFCFNVVSQNSKLKRFPAESSEKLRVLEEQYISLQKNREIIERKYKESQLINKITGNLARLSSKQEIIEQCCSDIIEILNYDRVIIFLADEEKQFLIPAISKGFDSSFDSLINNFNLEINITSNDPNKVSNVYKSNNAVLIEDVENHVETLTQESQQFLNSIKSKSYLSVPITSESRKFGVMCVDYCEQEKQLAMEDMILMENVCKQLALALDRSDAYDHIDKINKELEERVQQRTAQLIQSEKMISIGKLSAGIAHELNNPLNYIKNIIPDIKNDYFKLIEIKNGCDSFSNGNHNKEQMLQAIAPFLKDKKLQNNIAESDIVFEMLKKSIEKCTQIIQGLKVYTRKSVFTETQAINVKEMIKETLAIIPKKTFTDIDVCTDLSTEALVLGNQNQLQQILLNLIINARDAIISYQYQSQQKIPGKIFIISCINEANVLIKIQDNGPGVSEQDLQQIFDPFFTTKDPGKGTGLGLSICQEIAANHKGYFNCRNIDPHGFEVELTLPKYQEQERETA